MAKELATLHSQSQAQLSLCLCKFRVILLTFPVDFGSYCAFSWAELSIMKKQKSKKELTVISLCFKPSWQTEIQIYLFNVIPSCCRSWRVYEQRLDG